MNLAQASLVLASKLPMEDLSVKARFNRAYDIVRMPGYEITKQPDGSWIVDKLSTSLFDDESAQYTICLDSDGKQSCSCPDAQERAVAGLCKHRLAVALLDIMAEENSTYGNHAFNTTAYL